MKISVITTCYNSAGTISDTIKSVQSQTYQNIEHVIVDGASTDNTVEIARELADERTIIVSEPDNGIYDGMNKGIKLASGDVVGMLNGDDMFADNLALERVAGSFTDVIDCVHGNLVYADKDDTSKIVRKWESCDYVPGIFGRSWSPAHPTFYCRKNAYERFGLYKLDYEIAADAELMYRFLERYALKSAHIPHTLVVMRVGGVSTKNLRSMWVNSKEIKRAIVENGGRFNMLLYLYYKILKAKRQLSVN
ncbi:MAG: glycosyltransferase family 2 protein [Armatimonadetes bacterium]|nr:glycosyltransferase family 2 protein [Armatimonadota bacterium]